VLKFPEEFVSILGNFGIQYLYDSIIPWPVLLQVRSLFQTEFSTQCHVVLPRKVTVVEGRQKRANQMVSTTEDVQFRNAVAKNKRSNTAQFSQEDPTAKNDIDLLQFKTIPKLLSPEYFLIISSKIQASPETYLRSGFPNTFSQLRLDSQLLCVLGNVLCKYMRYDNRRIQPYLIKYR
jgi:hypothetical protein